jgi:hypothetical protein
MLMSIPALVVLWFAGWRAFGSLAFLLAVAIGVLILFPRDVLVAGHSLKELRLFYRPGALRAVFDSFFLRPALWRYKGIAVALASAAGLFLFLFVFS